MADPQIKAKEGEKVATKRTMSKRIEKAKLESEEIIKNMGGSLDVEGGRRTRSSTRRSAQTARSTPPPTKKTRTSSKRGRGKKIESEKFLNEIKAEKVDDSIPKKSDAITEGNDAQIENYKENDNGIEKSPIQDNPIDTTNLDKPQLEEKVESIAEEIENDGGDEKNSLLEKSKESNEDNITTELISELEQKTEKVPETNSPPVEAMEDIDASRSVSHEETDMKPSTESMSNDIQEDKKRTESEVHENSTEQNIEIESVKQDKIEENKTENDVCEPKISSPTTNSGDVVAAQPCN